MKHSTRSISIALLVLHIVLGAPSAFASDESAAQESGRDEVAVPVGSAAVDLLQRASDKQTQNQWNAAAALYEEILQKFPDQLIPLPPDGSQVTRYRNASTIVCDQLDGWPDQQLTLYKTLYGGRAASALVQAPADDPAALARVLRRYPGTEAAAKAGLNLLNRTIERGDLYSARAQGDQLLKASTLSDGDRARVICQMALASHWLGDDASAESWRQHLHQSEPTTSGRLGGREGALTEFLDTALKLPAAPPVSESVAPAEARFKQFKIAFDADSYVDMPPPQRAASVRADQTFTETSDIVTATDGADAFVQDGRAVYAFDMRTGKPLPGWPAGGKYAVDVPFRVQRQQLHIALTPSQVLAVLGQPDTGPIPGYTLAFLGSQPDTSRVVCIDRNTGRPQWTRAVADLLESAHIAGSSTLCGTPFVVAVNNSVLIPILRSPKNGFDDCYVISVSQDTGLYQWSTYIGGCAGQQNLSRQSNVPAALAAFEDTVYVMTNLGTVAAINPATGFVKWCDSYGRHRSTDVPNESATFPGHRAAQSEIQSWKQNPLIVHDGHAFVMPVDSSNLFVLDAESGKQQACLPRQFYNDADVLIGVKGKLLCLINDHDLLIVDWKRATSNDAHHGVLWREAAFTSESDNAVSGRGTWPDDLINLPTRNRLYQFSFQRHRIVSVFPLTDAFVGNDGVGNITVGSGRVLLTQPGGVTVLSALPPAIPQAD